MKEATTMRALLTAVAATATALVLGVALNVTIAGQASANPAIASKTGQPCAKCHTAPPALNAYGQSYKKKMK